MSRMVDLYLKDILRAVERINRYLEDIDETAFKTDDLKVDGVLFNLMTIGEAVKNIPEEMSQHMPEVRWREIGRFRDRVVHHYFALDLNVIWEIVTVHLPILHTAVEQLLQDLEDSDDNAAN